MNRTRATGLLLSLLSAAVGCGDEDFVCQLDVCGTGCVNLQADNFNCGACFNECGDGTGCVAGTCEPTSLVCDAPTSICGEDCVDLMTDAANCGACENTCNQFSECFDGSCAGPLVALRTIEQSKGDIDRDVYVVDDELEVHALGNAAAAGFFTRVTDHLVLSTGHVAIVGAQETEGVFELWLSSPAGGPLTKLSPPLGKLDRVLEGVSASADGSTILYRGVVGGDTINLFAVTVANPGVAIDLGSADTRVFALDATGSRAFAITNEEGTPSLFMFDLTVSPQVATRLNAPLNIGAVFDFVLSTDGTRLVYRAVHDDDGTADLFYVDLSGEPTVHPILNTNEPGGYQAADRYRLTADGSAVIYEATDGQFDDSVYLAPLVGPTFDSIVLAQNIDSTDGGSRLPVALTADAIYFPKDVGFRNPRLFKVALATPGVIERVFDDEAFPLFVDHVDVSPDGKHLVFGAGGDGGESGNTNPGTEAFDDGPIGFSQEVYHIDLTAPLPATPVRITGTVKGGFIENDFFVKNDGRVVIRGTITDTNLLDLFVGHPSLPDTVVKIGPVLDINVIEADTVRQIRRF